MLTYTKSERREKVCWEMEKKLQRFHTLFHLSCSCVCFSYCVSRLIPRRYDLPTLFERLWMEKFWFYFFSPILRKHLKLENTQRNTNIIILRMSWTVFIIYCGKFGFSFYSEQQHQTIWKKKRNSTEERAPDPLILARWLWMAETQNILLRRERTRAHAHQGKSLHQTHENKMIWEPERKKEFKQK